MSTPQHSEQQIRKECQKLVEDVIFHLLTVPTDWRYQRDSDWQVGQADTLKGFTKRNTAHLFNIMQDTSYTAYFAVDEEDEEEYYEAQTEIASVLDQMFPTIACLHGDDRDELTDKFIPRLVKIHSLFTH